MSEERTGFIAGFKDFISRGNAIDLAVGVVIGAAFGAVVSAIVDKFINPLIAGLIGKPNFDKVLEFHLGSATVQPGAIITALVNFLLVALAIYCCIIVPMNKVIKAREAKKKTEEEDEEPEADPQVELLTEIRDLLQAEKSASQSS
ncbi:large conductance mechanosensitive channel protein MscL [uncultured Varibaculum sp.]|uniref:large conductance mechanosensitive channel protein MscL n=1 Tax=uncultured Varibaculum sp. TaxID=413896 RepID=UPI0026766162|nr:large conductance mechanosensitive channel protein MscL [uncultured Varibaculum sp.]